MSVTLRMLRVRCLKHIISASMSSVSTGELTVKHEPKKQRFYAQLPSTPETAVLLYSNESDGSVRLYHTEVPPAYRGQGIAKILSKEALGHFVSNNQKMVLTCPYIQKYAAENPEPQYKDLIVNYIQKDDF